MAKFYWSNYLPEGNQFQKNIEVLNDFGWFISIKEQEEFVEIFVGEGIFFRGTLGECEALLTGMAITLLVLPATIQNEIKKLVEDSL